MIYTLDWYRMEECRLVNIGRDATDPTNSKHISTQYIRGCSERVYRILAPTSIKEAHNLRLGCGQNYATSKIRKGHSRAQKPWTN